MKKFYAFLAAALISVCAFASKDVVPSDAVIAEATGWEIGQVCACIYVPADMACNDIVFVGTYYMDDEKKWKTDVANLKKFEPIDGYDGWYAVAVEDETESPEGKPVMLDADGKFNWSYQIGSTTIIRGAVQFTAGLPGEIDLKGYGKDAPNVFTVDSWKSNPCTAIYHNYKITVINDGCGGFAVPYLVGAMTIWKFEKMTMDIDKTIELGTGVYYYNFKAAEGSEYQLTSGLMNDLGEIVKTPGWKDEAYLQKLVDGKWVRMPGESGDNLLTKEEAEITFDLRDSTLRWARCDDAPEYTISISLKAPADAPDSIEVLGGFSGWEESPVDMTWNASTNYWEAEVKAKGASAFKFRQKGTWDNQIAEYSVDDDEWGTFGDEGWRSLIFEEQWQEQEVDGKKVIVLDFSSELYKWTQPSTPVEPSMVIFGVNLPAGVPEAGVELVGNWDGDASWNTGIILERNQETGWYNTFAFYGSEAILIKPTNVFKIREAGTWNNQLSVKNATTGMWEDMDNIKFGDKWSDDTWKGTPVKMLELDFSDATKYGWSAITEGIESVVLTEKAKKVVVDGVIYIVRDNKMFNLQGAQVR